MNVYTKIPKNIPVMENVVIRDSSWRESDIDTLFEDEPVYITTSTELSVILKELGIYKSTSEARRAGRKGKIEDGWSVIKASRIRFVWIWNPIE